MIGRKIAHYRVVESLGAGGMGIVYRAVDTRLERDVALKFLPPGTGGEGREQFLQEAKAASILNHPNILTIYEIGESSGEPYIAMEYLAGETLRARLARGPLAPQEAAAIAAGVASGLGAAHARGIVHRDVKSDNVMLLEGGGVKLMDFGLARRPGGDLTAGGVLAGTPDYMSPEQVQGLAVGPPSDIFSLGVVIFEMLTRQLPFTGDYEVATLYAIVHSDPPRLVEIDDAIPPALAAIVDRALRKDPAARFASCAELCDALARVKVDSASPSAAIVARSPAVAQSGAFVGRERERAELAAALDGVANGSGTTMFISGESGVGKSRLASWTASEAHARRMNAFWGKAVRQEGGLPYHPFAAAFKRGFESFDDRLIGRLDARARELGVDLASRMPLIRGFLNLGAGEALHKEQLWEAVRTLVRVIAADRPMLLVIDDIQWADRETLGLFAYLARDIEAIPLLLVGIFRPGDAFADRGGAPAAAPDIVRQLTIEHLAGHIELGRFTREESSAALSALLGGGEIDGALASRVYDATLGNPLFLGELAGLMRSRNEIVNEHGRWLLGDAARGAAAVSARVHDIILERLDRLDHADRELLELASCEGETFQSDVLAACLGADRLAVLRRLQSLERNDRLIRHEKNRYAFEHPLIRTVLYESILEELREEFHRQIASQLERLGGEKGGEDDVAPRIAYHLTAAGERARALPFVLRAAKRARALCAGEDALRLYLQAEETLAGSDGGAALEIAEGLGDVCASLGRREDSGKHYARMLKLAAAGGVVPARIDALRKSSEALLVTGRIPEAVGSCEEALALAESAADPDRAVQCRDTLARIFLAKGEFDRVVALAGEAIEGAIARSDSRSRSQSLCTLGAVHMHRGDYRSALDRLEEAREIQERIGDTKGLAATLNFAGLARHRLGEYEIALGYHTESLRIKKSINDLSGVPGSLNNIGEIRRDIGDLDEAIAYHTRGAALAREQGNRGGECDNLRDLAADYLLRGDLAEAERALDEVFRLAKTHGFVWYETRCWITLADLALARGETEKALDSSRTAEERAVALDAKELMLEALLVQGRALLAAGRLEEAERSLARSLEIAEKAGNGIFYWQICGALAAAAATNDEREKAFGLARSEIRRIVAGLTDAGLRTRFLAQPGVAAIFGDG